MNQKIVSVSLSCSALVPVTGIILLLIGTISDTVASFLIGFFWINLFNTSTNKHFQGCEDMQNIQSFCSPISKGIKA